MGRYGYSHIGVTNSGVMDEYVYLFAQNFENPLNTNILEIAFSKCGFKAMQIF